MKTAEDIIQDKKKDMICISYTETIHKVLQLMVANGRLGLARRVKFLRN